MREISIINYLFLPFPLPSLPSYHQLLLHINNQEEVHQLDCEQTEEEGRQEEV